MTDPIADGEIKDAGNHSEASLVPEVVNTGAHEAEVPDTAMEGARNQPARQPSKEITLQRLTPHSSWEDIVSNESAARESNSLRRLPNQEAAGFRSQPSLPSQPPSVRSGAHWPLRASDIW
jgi:hypothetical protein